MCKPNIHRTSSQCETWNGASWSDGTITAKCPAGKASLAARATGADGKWKHAFIQQEALRIARERGEGSLTQKGTFRKNKYIELGGSNANADLILTEALKRYEAQSGTNSIEDRTPPRVQEYWKKYAFVKRDSAYQTERERKKNTPGIALRGDENEYDPAKHHPADPSDPDAYVPPYVRFEKRKQVNFTCPITGWKETDWVQPISGGKIRLVGELTLDHKLARSKNGRTTDENTRMVAWLANNKKSNNAKTDEEIRNNICSQYKVISVPQDLLDILTKYGLTEYR